MADDGSASNPRDPLKSSGWNVSVQRRRQQAVMVSKKLRKLLIWAKRQCKVGTNDADEMMIDEEQPILEAHTNIAVEELKSAVQYDHLPKELEMTSSMASSSSSGSRRYDVFPSFSGEDVRKSFLSHFLKELDRRLINTFIDHGIERSRPIRSELLSAIRESRIAIVVFSKKYASSTWCLDELVEIHKCYKEFGQIVIPVFYNVDPSQVRKQTGEFGKVFNKTCKGKPEDQKQRWMQALTDVANLAGEDIRNWRDEAAMIEKITNDVFNKLITPSNDFGDFVGIEGHLQAINQMLCWESEEVIMVGIVGPSGIGKTTIGRALFSHYSSQFHHRAFVTYKRTTRDDYGMRLCWQEQFLSDILCQKNIKIDKLGVMEQMLKHKKVFIVLDDVDDLELLRTLVGQTRWFGPKSRIIVISQDRRLLKAHQIHPIYEVKFPSKDLALKMLCRSAFGQNSPPDGFMELAVEVARLAGNLPLGLSVLGSSLRGMGKGEWMEMMPRLRNDLDGNIEKTLRVSYDRLDRNEQELFLYLAFAFAFVYEPLGMEVRWIKGLLGDSVNIGLKMLADKSLIHITQGGTAFLGITQWKLVKMHNLLKKLGREIVRAESINNPGKRRYLVDVEDIRDVFTDKTGTETVLGIYLNCSGIKEPLFIDENSFQGMPNLQFLIVRAKSVGRGLHVPHGLNYLPRKLRLLSWDYYPFKCLPSTFKAEFLVELEMVNSKLEKLWEGTQPLRSLKRMNMHYSTYLKDIPDLSNAINLEELYLYKCESLVTLPSSIQNAIKLRKLYMQYCTKLESMPPLLNLKSLERLNLKGCFRLRNFPQVSCYLYDWTPVRRGNEIHVEDYLWKKNLDGVDFLDCLRRCVPHQFRTEHIVDITVRDSMIEKLWEGVQSLGLLQEMDLSECGNLKEFPDLSMATDLRSLKLNNCKSLVIVPSTIGNLQNLRSLEMKECTGLEVLPTDVNLSSLIKLNLSGCKRLRSFPQISRSIISLNLNDTAIEEVPSTIGNLQNLRSLEMKECTGLEVLPTDVNLSSLETLDLSGCKRLRSFPQISMSIRSLNLNDTAIEEVPCCIENFSKLTDLWMRGCKRLKNISPNIFRLRGLERADFSECVEVIMALGDATVVETTEDYSSLPDLLLTDYIINRDDDDSYGFMFNNCFNLDGDARELILRSQMKPTILPGGRVPKYFTHRSSRNSLTVTLPQSSLSQEFLGFKACVVLEPITNPNNDAAYLEIHCNFIGRWNKVGYLNLELIFNTDHLVLFPLKFRKLFPLSELEHNDVEFEFSDDDSKLDEEFEFCDNDFKLDDDYESSPYVEFEFSVVNDEQEPSPFQRIKGCGIRVLEMSPSPTSSDGSKKSML